MISTKCDKCKNKAWCWSCDEMSVKVNHSNVLYVIRL